MAIAAAPPEDRFRKLFDDNYRTEAELIEDAESPIIERRLQNGTAFRVIKIPYQANIRFLRGWL